MHITVAASQECPTDRHTMSKSIQNTETKHMNVWIMQLIISEFVPLFMVLLNLSPFLQNFRDSVIQWVCSDKINLILYPNFYESFSQVVRKIDSFLFLFLKWNHNCWRHQWSLSCHLKKISRNLLMNTNWALSPWVLIISFRFSSYIPN